MKLGGTVHIVDDDSSLQKALTRLLKAAGYDALTYNSTGDFLLAQLEATDACILLDIKMSGPSGIELQEALMKRAPHLPIIFLTGHGDVATCARAMKNGAIDFLTKPVQREPLLEAVRIALSQAREKRESSEQQQKFRACLESLSKREKEVFSGVVAGKLNKEIAAELGTAERTVKAHRAHLMQKMQANSLAELVHISDIISFSARPRL